MCSETVLCCYVVKQFGFLSINFLLQTVTPSHVTHDQTNQSESELAFALLKKTQRNGVCVFKPRRLVLPYGSVGWPLYGSVWVMSGHGRLCTWLMSDFILVCVELGWRDVGGQALCVHKVVTGDNFSRLHQLLLSTYPVYLQYASLNIA